MACLLGASHQVASVSLGKQGSSQEQEWAGAWRASTFPLVTTEGETTLQGRAFGASLGASSQGAHPLPAGLLGSPAVALCGLQSNNLSAYSASPFSWELSEARAFVPGRCLRQEAPFQ